MNQRREDRSRAGGSAPTLLIVSEWEGDEARWRRAVDASNGRVRRLDDVYQAIGMLSKGSPPTAVLVRPGDSRPLNAQTIKALRRFARPAPIVLLDGAAADAPSVAARAGFPEVGIEPFFDAVCGDAASPPEDRALLEHLRRGRERAREARGAEASAEASADSSDRFSSPGPRPDRSADRRTGASRSEADAPVPRPDARSSSTPGPVDLFIDSQAPHGPTPALASVARGRAEASTAATREGAKDPAGAAAVNPRAEGDSPRRQAGSPHAGLSPPNDEPAEELHKPEGPRGDADAALGPESPTESDHGAACDSPPESGLESGLESEPVAGAPKAADEDQALGDVDLIDQLLTDRTQLLEMALQTVVQESGVAGVQWSPRLEEVPAGRTAVAVDYQGRLMGFLHAPPPIREAQLTPWAAWLARWLALRDEISRLWREAQEDELTGVWNRRFFNRFLDDVLRRAAVQRFQVTLMVFDIDDFKIYNDRYGHAAGDEILREAASLLQSVVRTHDVVARIGGDEFAVIFWDPSGPRRPNSQHPQDVRHAAERFRRAICEHRFPKLSEEAPGTLTISGGLASFPWDGRTPEALLDKADEMALCCKRQGKNALMFGPGALRECEADPPAGHP